MAATVVPGLDFIGTATGKDPGLKAKIQQWRIDAAVDGAIVTNVVITDALDETGVNNDHVLTPNELKKVADTINSDSKQYLKFMLAHGDDEGDLETGYHFAQNDGGTLLFQGRKFCDTVADAIGHIGFEYKNGYFVDEDGNKNQRIADIAGWMNYFMNGVTIVWGSGKADSLGSGDYSAIFKGAADETFRAYGGNDNIWAYTGNDKIFAGSGDDHAGGGSGNDKIYGGSGKDSLSGDEGNDIIQGGTGDDSIGGGTGNDNISGGDGNDSLYGDKGRDIIDGGDGKNQIGGGDGNDTLTGGLRGDKIYGDAGDDTIAGGGGKDELGGGDGDDTLQGQSGDDSLNGGAGDDTLDGGTGDDRIWGDMDNDTIQGGAGKDDIGGGMGNDTISGGDGNDLIGGQEGNDTINGDQGSDTLNGESGGDVIHGNTGNDKISGGDGADRLFGDAGNDEIDAGAGNDRIIGGTGADKINLWNMKAGVDTLVYAAGDSGTQIGSLDIIDNFKSGEDKIDLTAFGPLVYSGINHQGGGTASVIYDGTYMRVDADGDGATDLMVQFNYLDSLNASDFILA